MSGLKSREEYLNILGEMMVGPAGVTQIGYFYLQIAVGVENIGSDCGCRQYRGHLSVREWVRWGQGFGWKKNYFIFKNFIFQS